MTTAISGRVRRSGNSFVVTIPRHAMAALGLKEGDVVSLHVEPAVTALPTEVQQALDESWRQNEAGYRYLAVN